MNGNLGSFVCLNDNIGHIFLIDKIGCCVLLIRSDEPVQKKNNLDKKLASNAISSSSSGISSGGYKLTSSREPKYSSRLGQHSSRQAR